MGVNVEWKAEGEGRIGIVAEGTYLLDAARRLGARVPTECGGRGECDTCAVVVEEGATLLSSLTDAERTRLSPERLADGERLACQAKAERGGELRLRNVPATVREETTEETAKGFRDEFRRLPLRKKLAALAQLEAVTAYDTLVALADVPYAVFEKGLDLLAVRGRKLSEREQARRRPAEHVPHEPARAPGDGPNDSEP
jgi:ferredoxin